jgi:nitrogen fixation NifU-like protein
MSIYQEIILDHYRHPRNTGRLKKPTVSGKAFNSLCGDKISVDLLISKGKIKKIKYQAAGCVISQAAASILSEYLIGKTKEQLQKLDKDFMIKLLGIKLGANRIKCALLPLEVIQRTYGQSKSKRS